MSRLSPALAPASISASGCGSWARAGSRTAHRAGSLVWVRRVMITWVSSARDWLASSRSGPMAGGAPSR